MRLVKRTVNGFLEDDCSTMAAALAYYTVFSLPPLLVILITVAGFVFGAGTVQKAIQDQFAGMIGHGAGEQVNTMVQHATQKPSAGLVGAAVGIVALLFGATTAFAQLQAALNRIWRVKPDPKAGGIRNFVSKRLLSFGLILVIAFLLLVSLAVSAALAALGGMLQSMFPGVGEAAFFALDAGFALLVISFLFALMFKYLPDAEVRWRDVIPGAILTAVLFAAGKFALGFYLGKTNAAGGFGTAGSVVLILLWTYYASMILLFGAELTQAWARTWGAGVKPEPGAVPLDRAA